MSGWGFLVFLFAASSHAHSSDLFWLEKLDLSDEEVGDLFTEYDEEGFDKLEPTTENVAAFYLVPNYFLYDLDDEGWSGLCNFIASRGFDGCYYFYLDFRKRGLEKCEAERFAELGMALNKCNACVVKLDLKCSELSTDDGPEKIKALQDEMTDSELYLIL